MFVFFISDIMMLRIMTNYDGTDGDGDSDETNISTNSYGRSNNNNNNNNATATFMNDNDDHDTTIINQIIINYSINITNYNNQ